MKFKQWLVRLVVFMLLISGVTPLSVRAQEQAMTPGTYEASADGYGGPVKVSVTVSETEIQSIEVTADNETAAIGGEAISGLVEKIVANQSIGMDTVSGATISSVALLTALESALTEAGADLDALKKPVESTTGTIEDINVDVVVIGAGGAGLAAAIEAKEAGKEVVVLEQMPIVGGNTNRATGGMNASETSVQAELGIEDSNKIFYDDTFKGGHEINDPDLLWNMVIHSAEAIDWVNELGANLDDVSFSGGATNARIHKPKDGSAVGPILVSVLAKRLEELDVPIHLETKATKLLQNEDGGLTGVEAETADGQSLTVHAGAVVLATGGFGANQEMVIENDESKDGFETTNHPGADGSGIIMAQEIGADTYQIDQIQIHPTTQPGTGKLYTEGLRGDGAILINKDGKRFIDELDTRDVVSAAIIEQKDSVAYLVVNQALVDSNKSLKGYIDAGDAVKGETPAELAEGLEMDPATLEATLATYNEAQASGNDAEFGRENMSASLAEGSYYAIQVTPSIHHTMGGLKIDPNTHVYNIEGEIIPGLYAAGEVAGGVHGGNRIGGNAVTDIIVYGRIAGQKAAAYIDGDTSNDYERYPGVSDSEASESTNESKSQEESESTGESESKEENPGSDESEE